MDLGGALDALQGESEKLKSESSAAKERDRLRKREATIAVDAPATNKVSVEQVMKQRGIREGSREHLALLLELQE